MGTRRKKLFALSPVYIFVIVFNSFLELKKNASDNNKSDACYFSRIVWDIILFE